MYLRGALVAFMPTKLIPIPNVIVFQFNPETMTHTWTQPEALPQAPAGQPKVNPLAVKGFPGEQFSFTIAVDAGDTIADGAVSAALAEVSGVYTRLAAMEMLMFPTSATSQGLLGTVTAAIGGALGAQTGGVKRTVPANVMPTVLFVWGPFRIVPVRVTSLTITEKLYDGLLNPTHAEAQLGLRVLTAEELAATAASGDVLGSLAKTAYDYSMGVREVAAVANLVNSAESIIGMLPL
jgi:hypothetical protein